MKHDPIKLREGERLSESRLESLFPDAWTREKLFGGRVLERDRAGQATVRFVGVIVAGPRAFMAVPKVPMAGTPSEIAWDVIRALRVYASWIPQHHEPSPYLTTDARTGPVNVMAIADWLIRDYLSNGLHRADRVERSLTGSGRVDWRKTVSQVPPSLSQGRPVYLQTVRRRSYLDVANLVSMIHLNILDTLSRTFAPLLGYRTLDLDQEPIQRLDGLPPVAECEAIIRKEMQSVYAERSLHLFRMLLLALRPVENGLEDGLHLYGTSSFHHVWEAACANAFGNDLARWTQVYPRPTWTAVGGASQTADTFRPDIVIDLRSGEGRRLLIADAKYYDVSMPPALKGQPGVNDVAKQIWYAEHLLPLARGEGYDGVENVFLFPGRGELLTQTGRVELGGWSRRVDTFSLGLSEALRSYGNRSDGLRRQCHSAISQSLSVISAESLV